MMSAREQLRDSGLFEEAPTQKDRSTRFTVIGHSSGPSIYAVGNDQEVHIRQSVLRLFPNAERLEAYVAAHAVSERESDTLVYVLGADQLPMVLRIIRRGG